MIALKKLQQELVIASPRSPGLDPGSGAAIQLLKTGLLRRNTPSPRNDDVAVNIYKTI